MQGNGGGGCGGGGWYGSREGQLCSPVSATRILQTYTVRVYTLYLRVGSLLVFRIRKVSEYCLKMPVRSGILQSLEKV